MLQLVLACEKASVAAAKKEISVVLGGEAEREGESDGVAAAVSAAEGSGGGVEGGVG
jgi:hypothetical protein